MKVTKKTKEQFNPFKIEIEIQSEKEASIMYNIISNAVFLDVAEHVTAYMGHQTDSKDVQNIIDLLVKPFEEE